MKADEKGVQDLANCFVEFECDPFDSAHTVVMTLHSGEVASVKLGEVFATAHTQGEKLLSKNRYFEGIKNLMRPCTEIRGELHKSTSVREKFQSSAKQNLKWKTRPWLRWSLLVQKRRCPLKK